VPERSWNLMLREQLSFHWEGQLRPRLAGLTDEEYFWEPVPGCWNLRRRREGSGQAGYGGGAMTIDYVFPAPEPPPVTTIAWRLAHVIIGVFAMRSAGHFGGPGVDWETVRYAETADQALGQLDAEYARWMAGVESLGDDGLLRPVGDAEPYPEAPYAELVLHIHREAIHHLAEVCLLRDLYLWSRADSGRRLS
jgi:hypothetical protein